MLKDGDDHSSTSTLSDIAVATEGHLIFNSQNYLQLMMPYIIIINAIDTHSKIHTRI